MWEKMIDNMVQASQTSIQRSEGDYIVDGLLYCHKCNTPKQCKVEIFGKSCFPMCLCKCEAEKLQREESDRQRAEFADRVKNLRKMGFPDADMERFTFAADDKANSKVSTIARRYTENFPEMKKRGKGLLLFGSPGTGKTFIAACIANSLIDKGYPALVTNFARLVNTIQGMYDGKQEYIDNLSQFDLLVIDDLAAERDTEYMQETVTNIIDARYRSGKPLIVTTNLTANELKNPSDIRKQRIYSRLMEMCIPIEVAGKDRRKDKLREDYSSLSELLGIGGADK